MTKQDKRTPAFEDTDIMPFGKFKGVVLQDVQPSYLRYMFQDGFLKEFKNYTYDPDKTINSHTLNCIKLYNYIHNSWDAILMELKDED